MVSRRALVGRMAALSAVVFLGVTAAVVAADIQRNGGHFIYPVDDTYIHLAIARNFGHGQGFSIEPGIYSSTSSSPLWTLLLSLFARFMGDRALSAVPLLLNLLLAGLVLWAFYRVLSRHLPDQTTRFQARCALPLSALLPFMLFLPGLAILGMEHTLHVLLTLVFLGALTAPESSRSARTTLLLVAPLLPLVRPEGIGFVGLGAALFAVERRPRRAIALFCAGALPTMALLWWNHAQGQLWLPTSVAGKLINTSIISTESPPGLFGALLRVKSYLIRCSHNLGEDSAVLFLFIAVAGAMAYRAGRAELTRPGAVAGAMFLANTLAHAMFGNIGWFERYQAYLIASGVLALAMLSAVQLLLPRRSTKRRQRWVMGCACLCPLLFQKQFGAILMAPNASNDIYAQQWQMALFLAQEFPHDAVALNDIGAVSFLRPGPLLDLSGLASLDVLKLRMAGRLRSDAFDALARKHDIKMSVMYESWFGPEIRPSSWRKVAEWKNENRVVVTAPVVSFWATGDEKDDHRLCEALRRYEPALPKAIRVLYF